MSKKKRPRPEDLNLPCVGVDTHAHLDLDPLHSEVEACLDRAGKSGVAAVGNVFLGSRAYSVNRELFSTHPRVFFILGVHPHEASIVDSTELDAINQALDQDPNIKAIGEIGLDFHWDRSPRDRQRSAFQAQLDLARDRNKPVVIHSREAEEETLDILLDMGFQDRPLLWHCFGGDSSLAEQILARGWMVSIPGTVTFPKSRALQEAVRGIPLQQMVLETDCPFLAPEPYRSKRNEPAYSVFTAQKIAEERQEPLTDIWEQTGQTAREFFGLDDAK
ncbi:MAG: TatD family hydrolase [Desulfohalobiaceae bacterium]|nr:TatD family hydrolase [Desulfohalobiaceae bacterium]